MGDDVVSGGVVGDAGFHVRVEEGDASSSVPETCPMCGSLQLQALRCKVICRNCRTILQSCADL